MRKVLVLLSTYNGQKYLKDQLDSLYNQQDVDIHILVRDDGSKDNTLTILHSYSETKGNMTIFAEPNVGVVASFYKLIEIAASKFRDYDYFCFSDQDDFWFKDKVISGSRALDNSKSKYKLYFSGAVSTDSELNPIKSFAISYSNTFGSNVVSNHIPGCTMMFNGELLDQINKPNILNYSLPNGSMPLHDAWTAIAAYSIGADVIQGCSKTMYYRQHSNNVVGSSSSFFSVQWNRVRRYLKKSSHFKANKCIMALDLLGDEMPIENKKLLLNIANYRKNFRSKFSLLFDNRIYGNSFLDNCGTILIILLNKF